MSLRQLRRRAASSAAGNASLLAALRSELKHELSSPQPQPQPQPLLSQLGGFTLEHDDAGTKDVVLRRRGEREEVAVSGLLGRIRFPDEGNPIGEVLMKVCVKKLGFDPVLHFDCEVAGDGFRVRNVRYHRFVGDSDPNKYRGHRFGLLDPRLQKSLKEYLEARGINAELTTSLFQHLLNKEHSQYINWLRVMEGFSAKHAS